MQLIEHYIQLSQADRQDHLDLASFCLERGGNSLKFQGLLAEFLGTTIPSGHKIHLCHACNNSKCSNPRHLYWGTPRENNIDATLSGAKSIWQKMVDKHGLEEARAMQARKSNKNGAGNLGKTKSEHHRLNLSSSAKEAWNRLKAKCLDGETR